MMRTLVILSCSMGLCLTTTRAAPKELTREKLARTLYEALKANEFEHMASALPTEDDIKSADAKRTVAESRARIQKAFGDARASSAKAFDWSQAEFAGFEGDVYDLPDGEYCKLSFWVKVGYDYHRFDAPECRKVGRGWVCPQSVKHHGVDGLALITPFAKTIFLALQKNDLALAKKTLPVIADIEWTIATMEKHEPEGAKGAVRKSIEGMGGAQKVIDKARRRCREGFHRARKKSAADFDWSKANWIGIDGVATSHKTELGVTSATVVFMVEVDDVLYSFRLGECGRVGRGWIWTKGVTYLPVAK
ncbi:MAG: hypothetical protein OER88_05875 [Planctomycetota bacterium]|nr:hypothetical protein [Planctomycetota bacterium]